MLRLMVVGLVALGVLWLGAGAAAGGRPEDPLKGDCKKPKAEAKHKLEKPPGFEQLTPEEQALVPVEVGATLTVECGGGKRAAPATAVAPGWYACRTEAYVKNAAGKKILRLVQRQEFQISAYQTIQDWDPVDVETYAFLNWRTSGAPAIVGAKWSTYPWSIFASAKQKYVLDYGLWNVQTRYLWTNITAGPGNACSGNYGS